nr:RNA-directed DNA polymerase, eukaryota [Tanacetum cinerariifolium]
MSCKIFLRYVATVRAVLISSMYAAAYKRAMIIQRMRRKRFLIHHHPALDEPRIGGNVLKDLYPHIYALETCKSVTISKKLTDSSLDNSFRRKTKGGVEQVQYNALSNLVHAVTLVPSSDRWVWSLKSSREFSVALVWKVIDEKRLSNVNTMTRWIKYVPIKVNVLAWKIKTDALPTRLNISCRAIDIDSILCPICDCGVESSSHLFFSYSLARRVARKISLWGWMKEQQDRAEKMAQQQQQQAAAFQAQLETLRAELLASLGQLQGRPGGNGDQGATFPRSMRLDVLKFLGVDPESWIFAINEYFSLLNTPADQHLRTVGFNLEDSNEALSKLLQLGMVEDYQREFEKLMNKVTDIPDSLLISFYIFGLKLHLQREFYGGGLSAGLEDNKVVNDGDDSESSGPVTPTSNSKSSSEVKMLNWVRQAIDVENTPNIMIISAANTKLMLPIEVSTADAS